MNSAPLWPVQMLVWRHRWHLWGIMLSSQEPFAAEPPKPCQTQPCFSQDIICALYSCSQNHSNTRSNFSGWLLLYSAMLCCCCFPGEEKEMTKSSLTGGCGTSYLPTPTKVMFVIIWAAARSVFTVDISRNPMSSCFSLPASSCKVLLSTWDLLFIGLFRTCSEFKQWMHMFRCSVVLSNYLPCRT